MTGRRTILACAFASAVLLATTSLRAQRTDPTHEVAALLATVRGGGPPLCRRALETFVRVEALLDTDEPERAAALLAELWREHPPGTPGWQRAGVGLGDLNVGRPPAYYALRMQTDVAEWLRTAGDVEPADRAVLTVVLPGRSRGRQPADLAQLAAGAGDEVEHELLPQLLADDARIIRQSLQLFGDYVGAMTDGRLGVSVRLLPLPDLTVPVHCVAEPRRHAGLAPGALAQVWAAVPDDVRADTDWWWVVHPSHVPEQHADFARTEFVTGGMGRGPDGSSPCLLCDDRWLWRKPPHLGQGVYSELERRVYLPQWLQHEFFHFLFGSNPEFELERTSHQWFDRSTWPEDFEGAFEADYYHEALHRRLRPRARPPLHAQLVRRPPPDALLQRLRPRDLQGVYRREPRENDWHEGRIELTGGERENGRIRLRWRNDAGRSWDLWFRPGDAALETGDGNPYADDPGSRAFAIEFERGDDGAWLRDIRGFRFGGQLYRRVD
ncbi:MAG: hypothetical protein AB7O97_12465 [Planctomycetota bacterium]